MVNALIFSFFNPLPDLEFYDIVDYYYSLYKIWSSPDITVINNIYDKLIDACIEYRINKYGIHTIIRLIKKMFIINNKMATKTLLQNYKNFVDINIVSNEIWKCIATINDRNWDHVILIMIAELRIHFIPQLKTSSDRKDIYYKIDIENIIKLIRNNEFHCEKLDTIMNIFISKINKVYNAYMLPFSREYENLQLYYKHIVDLFEQMYTIISK